MAWPCKSLPFLAGALQRGVAILHDLLRRALALR